MWWLIAGVALAGGWPDVGKEWSSGHAGKKDAALVIAIEDYSMLADVPGAVETGNDWDDFFVEHRGIPMASVQRLNNGYASREGIRKKAKLVAGLVKPGGTLWVVYVGHGAPSANGQGGVLVGADAQQNADSLYARSVSRSELEGWLQGGAQSETVLVLDACFSGRVGVNDAMLVDSLQPALVSSLVPSAGVTLFSAGGSDEFAGPLPGLSRPGFSYLLLGALRGWGDENGDGQVTASEAISYAQGGLSRLQGRTQTPTLVRPAGADDLMMSRGRESGPDLRELLRAAGPQGERDGEVYNGDDFYAPIPKIRKKLAEQACEDVARESTSAWVTTRLGSASSSLKKKAESAWSALSVEARACLGLPRAARGECIDAVSGWLSKAEGAKVRVGAGVHQAKTSCGVREAVYQGQESAVSIVSVVAARALLVELKASDGPKASTSDAPKAGVPKASGKSFTSPLGVELMWVPGGTFTMGSPVNEPGRDSDETQHRVTVDGLYVMKTEVTQGLWKKVKIGNPSGFFDCGRGCPVESISWFDSVKFANKLSKKEGLQPAYVVSGRDVHWDRGANGYRLLTESEWEYAARGGESYLYAGSSELSSVGWYNDNSNHKTHAACEKQENGWGLCDMSGNVWEWVWDWSGAYPSGLVSNPAGANSGSYRVFRGGSWGNNPALARVAYRSRFAPGSRYSVLGLRLARPAP